MVMNFNLLKTNDIFPDVPVRRDHTVSIDKIMGYFDSVSTDGSKLFADIHVTEPTDVDKLARGTYRSRSLEVGMYVDNSEAAYWPVIFGVAYVDIPAVEGLHGKSKETSFFSMVPQEEMSMSTGTTTTVPNPGLSGQLTINVGGANQSPVPDLAPAKPAEHGTPQGGAPAATPPAAPATFRINGADTSDHAAVQKHIETLETVLKVAADDKRKAFVNGLVTGNKVVASQEAGLQAFALSLPDDQYAAWVATYEAAPTHPLLAQHGGSTGNPNAGAGKTEKDDQIEILTETVKTLHRVMSKEKVEQTDAFKQLAQLTATKS